MYLSAAVVPPWSQRSSLHAELAALCSEVVTPPEPPRGRWRRARDTGPAHLAAGATLSVTPLTNMVAHLTRFGYVDVTGAELLRGRLTELAASYEPALLTLGGSTSVDRERNLVFLEVSGQTEAVEEIFHAIHAIVGPLGFFQDRRGFELAVPVLDYSPGFDPDVLGQVRATLATYLSEPWEVRWLGLMRQEFLIGAPHTALLHEIQLGTRLPGEPCRTS